MTNAFIPLFYSITVLNFFGSAGLVEIMNGIFISNLWMTPLINLFGDIFYWIKIWRRRKIRKFAKHGTGGPYTQGEANKAYQKQEWWISYKYASLLKNFAVGLFYMHVIPYSMIYTLGIILVQFWTEKVSFIH